MIQLYKHIASKYFNFFFNFQIQKKKVLFVLKNKSENIKLHLKNVYYNLVL